MQKVQVQSHVGADGILHLDIPVSVTDTDLEVTITIKTIETKQQKTPLELGWPPGFFEETAGALADDPIKRYPQGELQERNWDDLSA